MKKTTSFLASALILAAFAGCKKADADTVITVGATPEPHAAILNLVAEDLSKDGYTLKVIEFTDYVTPNEAVESGEIDANYFQHLPYMDSFNKEKGYHLVSFAGIHIEPLQFIQSAILTLQAFLTVQLLQFRTTRQMKAARFFFFSQLVLSNLRTRLPLLPFRLILQRTQRTLNSARLRLLHCRAFLQTLMLL